MRIMRLNRYLAASGIASRRKCESIVESGSVTVNGQTVTAPFYLLGENDVICLDGEIVTPAKQKTVIVLNKPQGTVTSVEDTHGRQTVMDLIGDHALRFFPVGRLDKDTTGVLLLTNDGDLAYKLTHPSFQIEKAYEATICGRLNPAEIGLMEEGVDIGNGETGTACVVSQEEYKQGDKEQEITVVGLTMAHGKKREIRRIFAALGRSVKALRRVSFAGIEADDLDLGQWRYLRQDEIKNLMSTDHSE